MIDLLLPQSTPDQIRTWREAAGLTQAQACALMGYSWRGWQAAESGETALKPATVALFLLATGQHPGYTLQNIATRP